MDMFEPLNSDAENHLCCGVKLEVSSNVMHYTDLRFTVLVT